MSTRVASVFITLSLLALTGCIQRMDVHQIASGQASATVKEGDDSQHVLSSTQTTALSKWITARDDWSGMTMNVPDNPLFEVDMQGADGQDSTLVVYRHSNGDATAYLYHGHRLAPLMRRLSASDLAALQSLVGTH
jgi:hypothetical protein